MHVPAKRAELGWSLAVPAQAVTDAQRDASTESLAAENGILKTQQQELAAKLATVRRIRIRNCHSSLDAERAAC